MIIYLYLTFLTTIPTIRASKWLYMKLFYGRRWISPIGWFEVNQARLIGPDLIHQYMDKMKVIQERLKTTQRVEQRQGKCFFLLLLNLKFCQQSNLHTRTFNVLMPIGLHHIIMQTHVTRINITQCLVNPANHSESVVSLITFQRIHIYYFSVFFYFVEYITLY